MNAIEVFQLIRDKDWVYEIINGSDYGMRLMIGSGTAGHLMFGFKADGKLSYPSRMGFIPPEYKKWTFNEADQYLELRNDDDKVTRRFHLPVKQSSRLMMKDVDQNNRLVSFPEIMKTLHDQVAPVQNHNVGPFLLVHDYRMETPLEEAIMAPRYPIHRLMHTPVEYDGLREAYEFLISHPNATKAAIVKNAEYSKDPFDNYQEHKLTYNMEDFCLVGDRSILIEIIGAYITVLNQEALEQQMMDDNNHQIDFISFMTERFGNRVSQF